MWRFLEHLGQAFGNLEHRLLNEINHLRAMINLLLPPLYQQQYFAQPKPQLYQPVLPTTTISLDSTNHSKPANESDQMQNESPINITSTVNNLTVPSGQQHQLNEITPLAVEHAAEASTEKQLEFKPVQKKTGDRLRQLQSRCKCMPPSRDLSQVTLY